ncbi:hypothetical protein NMY22_g14185 [Coprinellus aureogranulatus]|nr:hypothetical protein NMY22_g14185 [Coprinellus aureogranulatus]
MEVSKEFLLRGSTLTKVQEIRAGKWQIVVLSPEMMLSKVFLTQVIRHRDMVDKIMSVVVDEAHVVSHWGSNFRKKYGTLGILRALLPRRTPFVAMSATLSPRVRKDVLAKLQFQKDFCDLSLGNDRKNVSIVVRAMQHPMNTYRDLDFLIPQGTDDPKKIQKIFIYADTLSVAQDIEDALYERCAEDIRYTGFIRPYSAGFPSRYRKAVMEKFRKGEVRILVCTDAAGMGCNIPDIDVVVQWKLPASVSSFVQRAGRAARGRNRTGLAVLLVEKSVYDSDVLRYMEEEREDTEVDGSKKRKTRGVRQATAYPKATKESKYAEKRGVLRGGFDKAKDATADGADVPLDYMAIDEGLYSFVQTGGCRRLVLTAVYKNELPVPNVPCCDNCCPELLDRTRPRKVEVEKRNVGVKRGIPNLEVMTSLNRWRVKILKRDFGSAFFSADGFLSDDLVEDLASVGPIMDLERLKLVLGGKWSWIDKYGEELSAELVSLDIPPMIPKPTAKERAAAIAQAALSTQPATRASSSALLAPSSSSGSRVGAVAESR